MSLQVHKFGGASVRDAENINNVTSLLAAMNDHTKVVIVSAAGKTTNALEKVVSAYMNKDADFMALFEAVKQMHMVALAELNLATDDIVSDIMDTFVEIDWILEEEPQDEYDYIYDQIVSVGELISSKMLYYNCMANGINVTWLDVRGMIITDNSYREAKVLWDETEQNINREINAVKDSYDVIISQGFIGSSTENFTTTLGREGSDYTAGIFSYCLHAERLSIWKDVPGILTADPRIFENVIKIDRLDYKEAIEMTYYGAKVIHPKTIKPLQNRSIPLYVRPFNNPEESGTLISSDVTPAYPPVIVLEADQIILHISTKDFSFVAEEHLSEIFSIMTELKIKVNMMRNTAISFSACIQNYGSKVKRLVGRLSDTYNIVEEDNLELITIRHYDGLTRQSLTEGKMVVFEETIGSTIRMAVKDIPIVKRKL